MSFFSSYTPCVSPITEDNSTGHPFCVTQRIGACIIDKRQFLYSEYKKGARSYETFSNDILNYNIDTNRLSNEFIRSYVKIFSGLRGSKKIIIVDSNNDNNFSDEQVYEFDTLTINRKFLGDTIELLPLIRVKYESILNNKKIEKYTYIRLKPFDDAYSFPNIIDSKLMVFTINSVSKEGTFKINEENFKISTFLNHIGDAENFQGGYYYKIQKKGYEYSSERYEQKKKETVVFGHTFQVIECRANGDSLWILYKGFKTNPEGGLLGLDIPKIQGVDSDGRSIEIGKNLSKNKYVVLEFWGSWCAPCINSIPATKLLFSKINKDKVYFVGIDYENNIVGKEKAKKIITENNY